MNMRHLYPRALTLATLMTIAVACRPERESPAPRPSTSSGPYGGSVTRPPQAPNHLQEDVLTRTLTRMSILQTYIERFFENHGSVPTVLRELGSISEDGFARASVDGWGRAIQYTTDARTYTLRSAGADAAMNSPDDVVVTGSRLRGQPCFVIAGDGRPEALNPSHTTCSR